MYSDSGRVGALLLDTMREELEKIGVIPGLNEEGFKTWIAGTIVQTTFVSSVMKHLENYRELTETDVAKILTGMNVSPESRSARDVLEIVGRWLRYFLEEPYEETSDTKKLIKARLVR